jgi:hypothetical protein
MRYYRKTTNQTSAICKRTRLLRKSVQLGYGVDDRRIGVRFPESLDGLWSPPTLIHNGYWELFLWGWTLTSI